MVVSIGLIRTYANMVYYGHMAIGDVPEPYVAEVQALLDTYSTDPIQPDYVHPLTHPADMIVEDATHRFVTDAEKVEWNSKSNAGHQHLAGSINVTDTNNRFTATNVEGVLDELFLNANDIKTKWSSVVGSPLVASDTSVTMQSKTQTIKTSLASKLTAKGQSSVGTETLTALVDKVASISTGKRLAIGSVSVTWGVDGFTVSGLAFRPNKIYINIVDSMNQIVGLAMYTSGDGVGYSIINGGSMLRPQFNTNSTGFVVTGLSRPNGTEQRSYHWTVIEA